jgi:diguanylate cyclase (GGDEF)-like protein
MVVPTPPALRADPADALLPSCLRADLLADVNEATDTQELADLVCRALAGAAGVDAAWLLARRDERRPAPDVTAAAGLPADAVLAVVRAPLCTRALASPDAPAVELSEISEAGLEYAAIMPFHGVTGTGMVLGVGRGPDGDPFDAVDVEAVGALARSAGHALERLWLTEELAEHVSRERALSRAARVLNATQTPDKVLETLCAEAAGALGAELAVVYAGQSVDFFMAVAAHGLPPSFLGFVPPESSLARAVLESGLPQIANRHDYAPHRPSSTAAFAHVRAAAAVPLRREGVVDGALVVCLEHDRWISDQDVELLMAFAELATAAQRNADRLLAAQRAAMVDPLTGCLNHAATQERLRAELSRAERTGDPVTLVLLDLQAFKAVNEEHGHLAGDSVLRTVGEQLRDVVRRHDVVGRFGGDEFALVLAGAGTPDAERVVARAVAAVAAAPLPGGGVVGTHLGIAEWRFGESAIALLERADSALRDAKRRAGARAHREGDGAPSRAVADELAGAERRIRKLATAAAIGARLTRLLDEDAIASAAAHELMASVAPDACALLRLADGELEPLAVVPADAMPARRRPQDEGVAGRCLRERRPVLVTDASRDPVHAVLAVEGAASALAVPVHVGTELWGVVELRSAAADAFDAEDARVVQTVADYVGAALRTALLYAELEASYMGAAEALAAALEAKDDYTADHARSIADLAVEVGRRVGLRDGALRDLRFGAIFHDIGKIAIPDAILNKPGPLTDEEFAVVKRHPEIGEQILAPIPFLAEARRIVRHDHERWDGGGYPDGLRGEEIPLGARIVLVVDAWHAMVSDRPYRAGLAPEAAREELRRNAGSQFDPQLVAALLRCLDEGFAAG